MFPDYEFWFTGPALISAIIFAYVTALSVIGIKSIARGKFFRGALWCLLPMILLQWWTVARQEEDKAKPERDYVYLLPSSDPRDFQGEQIGLVTNATGVLRDVKIAIQKTEDHERGLWNYIYSSHNSFLDEGTHRVAISLIPGDYMIDLDTPTKRGKVSQRLQLAKIDGVVSHTLLVKRKYSGEVVLKTP